MRLKQNINKIHGDLSNNFEEVMVSEKSDIQFGNYIEISVIQEGKNLKMIISKVDLESNRFNWKYYANPLNEDSDLVNRNSDINDITKDVEDIFEKNRFNSDYIESINNN